MPDLQSPVSEIPNIRPSVAKELQKLQIETVSDLLFYFPYRYEDFSNLAAIADIRQGEQVSIQGVVKEIKAYRGFRSHVNRAEAVVSDRSGSIKVVWFNQAYLANTLKKGDEIFLSGTARYYKTLQLQNPIYEKAVREGNGSAEFGDAAAHRDGGHTGNIHTARIVPVYRLSANLPLRSLRSAVFSALPAAERISETLPPEIVEQWQLLDLPTTVKNLHFPENLELLDRARQRIAFEEIFTVQLAVYRHKRMLEQQHSQPIAFNRSLIKQFVEHLPFAMTADQKKAAWDIFQDMEKPTPMNRLLEGDVGSGKTLVALTAALQAADAGFQVVFLCPTEILVQQHYVTALNLLEQYPQISLVMLTSNAAKINNAAANKKIVLEEIAHGGRQIIFSTHAILEHAVTFNSISLVIIDEQHRFGVRQRAALKEKSGPKQQRPHLLSMTATPIPRTLKLTLFGDLQISQLKHKPSGRKPVATKLVTPEQRDRAYAFISEQLQQGRQAFVVTPLIEENDRLVAVSNAVAEQEHLKKIFGANAVALLHGRMKAAEKETVMRDFLEGKTSVLVSTSVIEVGVDVPNASVMVIEGADRFGLAQLHQFRGRVGRAGHQSYCLLFTESANEKTLQRLQQFAQIHDGFELAELDLKTRGFGNIFGEEQSGFYYFKYFSFANHAGIAEQARVSAKKILEQDPELRKHPQLRKRIEGKLIHLE